LRKIKIFANRINDSEDFSETGKDFFKRILSAIDRMQNLIDALLSYSRITSAEMLTVPTDLNVIVAEVKENLKEEIDDTHVTLTFDKLPTLNVVPLQFHQLFINLVGNAIKYRRPDVDPVISITARVIRGADENLPTGSYHKISTSDNGIGFEQKYADRIFELFQRLHTRTEFEGTGIGLAICKKIVQNHNGFIKASSEPGKGSTFNIYLPVQNPGSFTVD
jgi:light-regulated signal transduction histidine kinase (bacteriophytochrome)